MPPASQALQLLAQNDQVDRPDPAAQCVMISVPTTKRKKSRAPCSRNRPPRVWAVDLDRLDETLGLLEDPSLRPRFEGDMADVITVHVELSGAGLVGLRLRSARGLVTIDDFNPGANPAVEFLARRGYLRAGDELVSVDGIAVTSTASCRYLFGKIRHRQCLVARYGVRIPAVTRLGIRRARR